jgi:enterochelin esterase-like enzyme
VLAAAPLLMLLFALDQSAVHYAYPPDLRTLLGFEVPGAHRFRAGEFTAPAPPGQSTLGGETPAGTIPPASPGKPLESTWQPTAMAGTGQLLGRVPIPGTISGFAARSAYVYLPPAYFSTPRPVLPVMVLLSGVPGQPKNYLAGLSTQTVYTDLARQHAGLTPILVFADYTGGMTDDLGCIDSPDGDVETYLTRDVPAFVEQTFGSAQGPAGWGIGGFSDGGTCALTVGLRHPDVFGPILAISADEAPSLDGSQNAYVAHFLHGDPGALAAHSPLALIGDRTPRPHTTVYFESGDGEPAKQRQTIAMAAAARQAGIPTQLVTKPGKHNFDFWKQCIADSAPWVARALGVIA